jgi:hypothetical protein
VSDLKEQLASTRVEYEDSTIDRLSCQIALKGLVYGHSVHIGVVYKPDDLVAEQLSIVLAAQVRLSWLRAVVIVVCGAFIKAVSVADVELAMLLLISIMRSDASSSAQRNMRQPLAATTAQLPLELLHMQTAAM